MGIMDEEKRADALEKADERPLKEEELEGVSGGRRVVVVPTDDGRAQDSTEEGRANRLAFRSSRY